MKDGDPPARLILRSVSLIWPTLVPCCPGVRDLGESAKAEKGSDGKVIISTLFPHFIMPRWLGVETR